MFMRKAMLGSFMTLGAFIMLGSLIMLGALQAFAQVLTLKPGLWEIRMVKQIRDGKDMTAQITGAMTQMQERLAKMPPEQRAKMEAMMGQSGAPSMGSNGSVKMCVTPEQARQDKPLIDREGCRPATVNRSGNHSTFEYSCTTGAITTSGKGESTTTGDVISTVTDSTTQRATGDSHVLHTETEMKFLGPDCGDVKPMPTPKQSP
jgi:hypothetical protein